MYIYHSNERYLMPVVAEIDTIYTEKYRKDEERNGVPFKILIKIE